MPLPIKQNEVRTLELKIEQLEKELKFKNEMIAAMNTHGRALELETRELKEQLRNGGQ